MIERLEDRLTPATHVWSGAVSSSWNNVGNWSSGGIPVPGEDHLVIVFPGGTAGALPGTAGYVRAASVNDLPGPTPLTVGEIDITGTPSDASSFNVSGNAINLGNGTLFTATTGNPGNIEDTSGNPNDVINFAGIALAASAPETLPPNPGAFFTGHDISKDGPGSLTIASPLTGPAANLTINYAPTTAVTPSSGNGEVILTAANSYGGTTAVGGGVLSVGNDLALGAAGGTPATGTFLVSAALGGTGGNIELSGPAGSTPVHVGNEYLDLASTGAQAENPAGFSPPAPSRRQFDSDTDGDSWGGPIVLSTTVTTVTTFYTVAGTTLTLTGPISGAALVKDGNGTLILGGLDTGGQANTYSGLTSVRAGTLTLAKSTALGATGPGSDTVLIASSKLKLTADLNGNPIAVGAEGLTVRGTAGLTRLENVSGNNSFAGDIQLKTATTVQVDSAADTLTLTGVISGISGNTFTKQGAGTLTLAADNTYGGVTDIELGTLDVNGAQGGSPVTVAAGGTLGGTGTTGAVGTTPQTDLGTINPAGPSATGTLNTTGDVSFSTTGAGGNSSFDVDLVSTSQHDLYHAQGSALNLGNADLHVNAGALNAPGTPFTVLQADGGVFGQFANAPEGSTVPGTSLQVHYTANSVVLTQPAVAAPAITSAASATFTAGTLGSFTVTATGIPTPTLSESASDTLPGGVAFDAGTGVLSGTPASGSGGTYTLHFTAANGVGSDATQTFTLTVDQAPAITSAAGTTFTVGQAGSFAVTASGFPAPTLGEGPGDTLPGGVTFDPATGVLSGTPAAGSGGTYTLHFTAANGAGSAPQTFTLTVSQPAITGPADVTALVNPQLGPLTPVRRHRRKVPGLFQQTVTITNNGPVPLQGNLVLVLGNLAPRKKVRRKLIPLVKVLNAGGSTQTVSPGSPFIGASTSLLPPQAQTTFNLAFKTTGPGKITFSPRVLIGFAQP